MVQVPDGTGVLGAGMRADAGAGVRDGVDPAALAHDDCLALLESIEAERAALDALQQRTLAVLHHRDTSPKGWVADEVACLLRLSPCTVPGLLQDARELVDRLPHTLHLLAAGSLTMRHARALVDAVRPLDDATTRAVEERSLRAAHGRTVSEFRRTVRRAVTAVDPRRAEERHADAAAERRLVCTPAADGMSEIWATLPTDAAARVMARIRTRAAAWRGRDDRTADQRRADALVDLIDPVGSVGSVQARDSVEDAHNSTDHGESTGDGEHRSSHDDCFRPDRPISRHDRDAAGPGPSVHLTVALTTLLELDDQPGDLAGHGPVPASVARRIAADPTGTWRRLVTDPVGGLLSVSRAYRPPPAMRKHVAARDRTCRFPGCGRVARACEIDHLIPWDRGGPTAPHNLHALCSRHHHLKHEAPGWSVERGPDGVASWRTPSGRIVNVPLEPYDVTDLRLLPHLGGVERTDPPERTDPSEEPDPSERSDPSERAGSFVDPVRRRASRTSR